MAISGVNAALPVSSRLAVDGAKEKGPGMEPGP
jgi:hypothetical protein